MKESEKQETNDRTHAHAHAEAHLMPGRTTTRDVFGTCRGKCARCVACALGYEKRTDEYYVNGEGRRTHPHNDISLQNCSRCGCAATDHEVDVNADARARGNDYFERGAYDEAAAAYTRAIAAYAGDAKAYSNRAACYLKREPAMPRQALHDAEHAVRLDPTYVKGRTRLGSARLACGMYDEAEKAFAVALKLDPDSSAAKTGLEEVRGRRRIADDSREVKNERPTTTRREDGATKSAVASSREPVDSSSHAVKIPVPSPMTLSDALDRAKSLIGDIEGVLRTFRSDVERLEAILRQESAAGRTKEDGDDEVERPERRVRVEDLTTSRMDSTTNRTFGAEWEADDTEENSAQMKRLLSVARGEATDEENNDEDEDKNEENNDEEEEPGLSYHKVRDRAEEMLKFFQEFEKEDTSEADLKDEEDEAADDSWAEKWEEEQFSRQNRVVSAPDGVKKRTPLETKAKRPPGLKADSLASLFKTPVETAGMGDEDIASVLRGPCKTCGAHTCISFARLSSASKWNRPVLSALSPMSETYRTRLTQLTFGGDGSCCARCGCAASEHCTKDEFEKIVRKQRAAAQQRASAKMIREERIRLAAERVATAEKNDENVCETTCDMMIGAERRGCQGCAECPGFRVMFRESDAMNPEVMFYCSMCGCPYDEHVVCAEWRQAQDERKREWERETYEAKSRHAAREAQVSDSRAHLFQTLNVPHDASKRDIAKAYKMLALKFHPDKHAMRSESDRKRAALNFIRVTEAFKKLSAD